MSASDHSLNFKGKRYVPDRPVKTLDRRQGIGGNAYWRVSIDGAVYHIARERGNRAIRIPYKPRGENYGYHYYGVVRDEKANTLWDGKVFKSTGPLAMLHDAGIIRWQFEISATQEAP